MQQRELWDAANPWLPETPLCGPHGTFHVNPSGFTMVPPTQPPATHPTLPNPSRHPFCCLKACENQGPNGSLGQEGSKESQHNLCKSTTPFLTVISSTFLLLASPNTLTCRKTGTQSSSCHNCTAWNKGVIHIYPPFKRVPEWRSQGFPAHFKECL